MGTAFRATFWVLLCVSFAFSQGTQAVFPQGTVAAEVDTDGYIPDPEAADAFAKRIPKFIKDQVELLGDESDDTSVFLYRYHAKARGESTLATRAQGSTGSCVGQGFAGAVDTLAATEILAFGEPEQFVSTNADALYGLSRRNNLGRWDGSVGSWAADAISNVGTLHQLQYPGHDLREESDVRARQYAATGVPRELLKYAEKHKVLNVARVETVKQLRGLIQSGYPVAICTTIGFANGTGGYLTQRDSLGFAQPRSSWAHCQYVPAYRGQDSGRRGFLVCNSWRADAHDAPPGQTYISGPTWPNDEQPLGSYWVDANTMQKILNSRDCWSVAGYQGFPKRKITLKDAFTYPGGPKKELPESSPNYQLAP